MSVGTGKHIIPAKQSASHLHAHTSLFYALQFAAMCHESCFDFGNVLLAEMNVHVSTS